LEYVALLYPASYRSIFHLYLGLRIFTLSDNEKARLDNILGGKFNGRRAREKFLEAIPSPSISLLTSA
jgi:hypothetical protein